MWSHEISSHTWSQQPVAHAYYGHNHPPAVNDAEQTGIAREFGMEEVQAAHCLLGLEKKCGVVFVVGQNSGIVDMKNACPVRCQLLTENDIFVAVDPEPLVETD